MMKAYITATAVAALLLFITVPVWAEVGYTVRDGESLEKIAAKFNISVEALMDANEIEDSSSVESGTRLIIPIGSDNHDQYEKESWGFIEHTIKSGDTLSSLSKKYRCSIESLTKLNEIEQNKILNVGDPIKIPIKEKKNPITLFDLSEIDDDTSQDEGLTVNVNADSVKGKNLLNPDELKNPQTDSTPNNKKEEPKKNSSKAPAKPKYIYHTIQKGDSISRIANLYDVSQKSIMQENDVTGKTILQIGRKLRIPNPAASDNAKLEKDDGLVSRNLTERDKVVRYALQHLGVRYKYSGANLNSGVDCSGFTMEVYERFRVNLPHSSSQQAGVGRSVEKNNLVPGDLVFFRTRGRSIGHVGIYIGDNKFVHSTRTGKGVIVSDLSEEYYLTRYVCARRVL